MATVVKKTTTNKLQIKLINGATMPKYETDGAAAFDLTANADTFIHNTNNVDHTDLVPTGVCIAIPDGYVGLLMVRSSIGVKTKFRQSNCVGVIDSDYRGEIKVPLEITAKREGWIERGTRIAQLMVVPCHQMSIEVVEDLQDTKRGQGGFGSTNKGGK